MAETLGLTLAALGGKIRICVFLYLCFCLFVYLYLVGLGGKIRDALSALCLSTDTGVNASTAHGLCWIEQHTRLPFNPTQNCSLSANPLSISKNGGEKLPMPTTNLYDKIQILYFTTCVLM